MQAVDVAPFLRHYPLLLINNGWNWHGERVKPCLAALQVLPNTNVCFALQVVTLRIGSAARTDLRSEQSVTMSPPPRITPQDFVDNWRSATLKERSAYQEHFIDLCRLIGHPTPAEVDPISENFAFEYGAAKTTGGQGFADVFKRRCFALEYKGKHADLDKAYQQLLNYREALQNPPLLVVCDIDRLIIHTNFTNTRKRTRTLLLDDLLTQCSF